MSYEDMFLARDCNFVPDTIGTDGSTHLVHRYVLKRKKMEKRKE